MVLHQPVAATRGVSCRGSSPLQLFDWPSCSTHPLKPLRAALLHALLAAPAGFKSFAIFTWNLCTRDAEGLMLFAFQVYDAKGRGVMGACEITRRSCEAGGRYRKQRMRWSGRRWPVSLSSAVGARVSKHAPLPSHDGTARAPLSSLAQRLPTAPPLPRLSARL